MAMAVMERESVVAREEERQLIEQIDHLVDRKQLDGVQLQLMATFGETDGTVLIRLPETIVFLLGEMAHALARGEAVSIVPDHKELTTQEAADFLNVSRQYFVRLLDKGALPHHRVGSHRRVTFGDLLRYRRKRDAERATALDELDQLSQEMGMY